MIDPGKRNAIYQLHLEGMSQREISRLMCVSRKAVKRIIEQRGKFVLHLFSGKHLAQLAGIS